MDTPKPKKATKRTLPAEIKAAVKAAQDKKAEDILVLDLREAFAFTDFFVVMHGLSSRQNGAIAGAIEQELKRDGLRPLGVEGAAHGEWVLMDYGFFVVHVFSRPARAYYSLEKLWGDVPRIAY
jgi:ribosome-associated protein